MRQIALVLALVALGACHNEPSTNHDTTGMANYGASGSLQPNTPPVVGPGGPAPSPTGGKAATAAATPAATPAASDTAKKSAGKAARP